MRQFRGTRNATTGCVALIEQGEEKRMTRRIERLLSSLREAIHEAIGESPKVASVLAELECEGHSPSFLVDVGLPEGVLTEKEIAHLEKDSERELPVLELVTRDGPLILTASDQGFLRDLGIVTPASNPSPVPSMRR
jgi:hypothetical protein